LIVFITIQLAFNERPNGMTLNRQHGWMLDVGCFFTSQPEADRKGGWCSSNGEQ